jgi:hypothetical protein
VTGELFLYLASIETKNDTAIPLRFDVTEVILRAQENLELL